MGFSHSAAYLIRDEAATYIQLWWKHVAQGTHAKVASQLSPVALDARLEGPSSAVLTSKCEFVTGVTEPTFCECLMEHCCTQSSRAADGVADDDKDADLLEGLTVDRHAVVDIVEINVLDASKDRFSIRVRMDSTILKF